MNGDSPTQRRRCQIKEVIVAELKGLQLDFVIAELERSSRPN